MRKLLLSMMTVIGLALAGTLSVASPASAYPGCGGFVRMQTDNWAETVLYSYHEALMSPVTSVGSVNLSAKLQYYYCPNGDGVNKIVPMGISWCWGDPDNHTRFTGVTFNANVYDNSGESWNPGDFKVGDDGTNRNCRTQFSAEDHWLQRPQNPRWRAKAQVNVIESPDTWWNFTVPGGGLVNSINIDNPATHGDWHL